ncbi:MAG: hypothetical protein K8R25_17265 [Methanosarcinales archaeon]|nr:hypothetical protein [Methanosarcinales archaeon]
MSGLSKFHKNERGWADYLITRAGILIFCSILLLLVFKIPALFTQQNEIGMLDAQLCSLTSFIEGVDGSKIRSSQCYEFDIPPGIENITIGISSGFVCANSQIDTGGVTRAQALIRGVYPSNSLWNNSSEMMLVIADMCDNRTGLGDNLLNESDMQHIDTLLYQVKTELANESYIPDTTRSLIAEKVMLDYRTPGGIQRRGITVVYQ